MNQSWLKESGLNEFAPSAWIIGATGLTIATVAAPSAAQAGVWRFHDEYVLGTRLDLLVTADHVASAWLAAHAVRAEIDRLNALLNSRLESAELFRLNRVAKLVVSSDLFAVLRLSEAWRSLTAGAYDGRLGAALRLWREARDAIPSTTQLQEAIGNSRAAIGLHHATRTVTRPNGIEFALDGLAKGYIVDAALHAARCATPGLQGMMIGIGGDIACWGVAPHDQGWRVSIPDARYPADNAPIVAAVRLTNQAIATSGRGPRDRSIEGRRYSATLSPTTGQPVDAILSATAIADCTAHADALATACMVLQPEESLALVNKLDGAAVRIVDKDNRVHVSPRWLKLAAASASSSAPASKTTVPSKLDAAQRWPRDWVVGVDYVAPERQDVRSADFRTPYLVIWITDTNNKPIRTVFLVGIEARWHRDNFVWWTSNRPRADQLVELRSQSTASSGHYRMYWSGIDDDWQPVPLGTYILHIESSRERGQHTHRSIALELGQERFKTAIPNIPEAGGIEISYGHPDDR